MNRRKQLALVILVTGIFLAILAGVVSTRQQQENAPFELQVRGIFPAGTPTPAGYESGIYLVRELFSNAGSTITPVPGVAGVHIEIYWDDVQAAAGGAIDWSPVATQIAYADSLGYQSVLSLQFFQNNYSGLDLLNLPSGVGTVSYTAYRTLPTPGITPTVCSTEVAPDYGDAALRNAYATVVASMMSEYGADERVAGFAMQVGASGEAMNVQSDTCTLKRYWFEAAGVTCAEYQNFVIDAAHWYRAGTDKPITLAAGIASCYQSSYNADYKANRYWIEKLNTTPTTGANQYIAYRHNGLAPDSAAAMYRTPTPGPYGRIQPGYEMPDEGGIAFEPGSPYGFPTQAPTVDVEGHADYMVLNAASANTDMLFLQNEWYDYISANVWNVVTKTLGTTASDSPLAWVWFRESEYKENVNGLGYYYSGVPGAFTHLASIVSSATPTTYCSPNVYATSVAYGGSSPPNACSTSLTSPSAPESRNTLGYASGSTIGIDIADTWQYADNNNNAYTVDLRYLDNNSGTITVAWRDTGGSETTRTIEKASSGVWVTDSFTMTAALNDQYTTHDMELRVTDSQTQFNSLVVEYGSTESTPTPTVTPTASNTPTQTATPTGTYTAAPTDTATPSQTPTPTPTNTGTITPTYTPSITPTASNTPTPEPTYTPGPTASNATRTPYAPTPDSSRTPLAGTPSGTRTAIAPTPYASRTPLGFASLYLPTFLRSVELTSCTFCSYRLPPMFKATTGYHIF